MNWKRVPIGSVSKVVTKGTTPTSIGFNFANEGIPFLRVNNIQNGKLIINDILFIDSKTDEALARSRIQPKDVLISIAGTIGRTAVVPPGTPAMNCNQAVAIIRFLEDVDPYYVNYWLNTDDAVQQITGVKVTATISNLSLGCIKELKIPLPPLEEQRRIAAILDKADAVRRKRQSAIALTEELLRSAFLEMFGDPVTNPKGWEIVELGEMLSIVSGQVDPQQSPYIDMPHIGGENIQANTGRISGVQTPREIGLQSGKYLFETTDVLYSKIRPYLNKVVIPGFIGVCSADIYPLRVNASKLNPQYLVYLLRSNTFLEYAEKHSARTNIPKINRPALLKFSSPYPPLNLQKKFSEIYDKVHSTKNQINYAVEDGNNLFNSLLQRAFRGEL